MSPSNETWVEEGPLEQKLKRSRSSSNPTVKNQRTKGSYRGRASLVQLFKINLFEKVEFSKNVI